MQYYGTDQDDNAEQQPMAPYGPGFYSSSSQDSDDQITKWTLNTDDQLRKLEQYLSGKKWDGVSNSYVEIPNVKPMMNDAGIRFAIFTLRGVLDKNTALSDINASECQKLVRSISLAFLRNLAKNSKEYELNIEDLPMVCRAFRLNLYLLLKRSVGGGERDSVRIRVKEQLVYREGNDNNKKSILPSWR